MPAYELEQKPPVYEHDVEAGAEGVKPPPPAVVHDETSPLATERAVDAVTGSSLHGAQISLVQEHHT